MATEWHSLKDDPPVGNRCVVLFPIKSDCGIFYSASNPEFARQSGVAQGYTHYAYIDPAPGEAEMEVWQAALPLWDGEIEQ